MSQAPTPGHPDGPEPAAQRAASVTLRRSAGERTERLSMDPAHKSLADALRITFFLLQVGMAVLIGLFLLSGARQVQQAERGVRLTFGRVVAQDVPPGLHFSWPYPIGEFITIDTGQEAFEIDEAFMPVLTEAQRRRSLDEADMRRVAQTGLKPGQDGSLITADGAIVHAMFSVTYRREDPASFVRNVHEPDEERLVRAAVERAVVQAVAHMPIDDVLKERASAEGAGEGGLASEVRAQAQRFLDAMDSGIRVEQVILKDRTPPLSIRPSFSSVQAAQSSAERAREVAEQERRELLNAAAGAAHQALLDRIDAYEAAVELGREAEAAELLTQIDALLEGEPVEIDGREIANAVSGEVTNIIGDARQYRTEVVSESRALVDTFSAKLEQYRESPAVLINREWVDAMLAFLAQPGVSVMTAPPGADVALWINRDPKFDRQDEARRNLQEITGTLQGVESEFRRRLRENREAGRSGPNRPGPGS